MRAAELYRWARGLVERALPMLQARDAALKQSIAASVPGDFHASSSA